MHILLTDKRKMKGNIKQIYRYIIFTILQVSTAAFVQKKRKKKTKNEKRKIPRIPIFRN